MMMMINIQEDLRVYIKFFMLFIIVFFMFFIMYMKEMNTQDVYMYKSYKFGP